MCKITIVNVDVVFEIYAVTDHSKDDATLTVAEQAWLAYALF